MARTDLHPLNKSLIYAHLAEYKTYFVNELIGRDMPLSCMSPGGAQYAGSYGVTTSRFLALSPETPTALRTTACGSLETLNIPCV